MMVELMSDGSHLKISVTPTHIVFTMSTKKYALAGKMVGCEGYTLYKFLFQ